MSEGRRAYELLTVAEALSLPILRRAVPEVLAGADALERPLRWVHVLDVDPTDLLRGGELILSTGLVPALDEQTQRSYVRALVAEGAAGLVIELGMVYPNQLPEPLVEEARAGGLPLVALHRRVRFLEVTEAVHGALVDRQLGLLQRGQETTERLTAIVLAQRGLAELMEEIARTVGNPVVLENLADQMVAFAAHHTSEDDLLEARAEHHHARERGAANGRGWLQEEVRVRERPWGRLLVLDLDRPLEEEDGIALARAATAVSLELLHEHNEEQLRARARGSFLVDLMQERLLEADAQRKAATLEFTRDPGLLLAVALAWRSQRWSEVADSPENGWALLTGPLRAAFGAHRPALVGLHSGQLLLAVSVGASEPAAEQLDALAAELRRPLQRRGFEPADVALAFGRSATLWTELGKSLDRCSQTVGAAPASAPLPWLDARRGTVTDLLYSIRATPALLRFSREQLGVLYDAREPRERELLHTLEVFLRSGGRKAEAARALHLERQSLYVRLERLENMLGVDLDDPDAVLALNIAVRTLRLTQALSPTELIA